jgi:hypothetical protein
MMRLLTVLWTSVFLVLSVIACAPIDGSTVACDIDVPTDAGTLVHAWCSEDYGVPPDVVPQLQAECEYQAYPFQIGTGTVRDACPMDDVYATCSDTLAAPDGEKTVLRMYFYGPSNSDAGPDELGSCPRRYE